MVTAFRIARNVVLALVVLGACLTTAAIAARIIPNTTESMPTGFYRQTTLAGAPKRGQLVIGCMPQWAVRYRRAAGLETPSGPCADKSISILKIVAAVPGDTVRVTNAGVFVNGRLWPHSKLHARNSRGGAISHRYLNRTVVIPAGSYWLMTPDPDSFDSRYWGPTAELLSGAVPVWTRPSYASFTRDIPGMVRS